MPSGARAAEFVERAHGTHASQRPPRTPELRWLRLFSSLNVNHIVARGGAFAIADALSLSHGEPFVLVRANFEGRMRQLPRHTDRAAA